MGYQSQRQRINNFLTKEIAPILEKRDLDFDLVLKTIQEQIKCSENIAREGLENMIRSNRFKEIHIISLSEDQTENWLDKLVEEDKRKRNEIEKADKIVEKISNKKKGRKKNGI